MTQKLHTHLLPSLTSHLLPRFVRLVEVGPRDGLQAETTAIRTEDKIAFIKKLSLSGLKTIEATAFVNPKAVPQMSDAREVLKALPNTGVISYPVLVPNLTGYTHAIHSGAREVSIFTAASEVFQKKNGNSTIDQSLQRFSEIFEQAKIQKVPVRGYVSCVIGCPYQGIIDPQSVLKVVSKLLEMGCYEVSLGDTIGVGTPGTVSKLFETLILAGVPVKHLAAHFHNTFGMAIANLFVALQYGIAVIDSSVGGIGGCPFAKGATGNVSTHEVIYLLESLGIGHGVDLEKLDEATHFILEKLGKPIAPIIGRTTSDHPYFKQLHTQHSEH